MAEFRQATKLPTATNMSCDGLAAAAACDSVACGRYSAGRSSLLDDAGLGRRGAGVPRQWAHLGLALEHHFDVFAGNADARCRRCSGYDHGDRHALDLAVGQHLTRQSVSDSRWSAESARESRAGASILILMPWNARTSYTRRRDWARAHDAMAMQFLISGWKFDPNVHRLVR